MNVDSAASRATHRIFSPLPIALFVFGVSLILAALWNRAIFADGAWEFLQTLQQGTFAPLIQSRAYASDVFELPLVLAIKCGVTNLPVLRLLFGLGCFLPWPVALWLCHKFSPKNVWIVVVACAAGYLNTSFMAIGEDHVAHAFFWPALFVLLFIRSLTAFAAAVLLIVAVVLQHCYESLLFLGPALALLSGFRAVRAEHLWQKAVFWLATGLFLSAACIALAGFLFPEAPQNLVGFKGGIWSELRYPSWLVMWSLYWSGLTFAYWLLLRRQDQLPPAAKSPGSVLWEKYSLPVCFILAIIWGGVPLLQPEQLEPSRQYGERFLNLVVPFGLLPVALVAAWRSSWLEPQRTMLVRHAAIFLLAQSIWQIGVTWQWHEYLHTLDGLLASQTGPFRLKDTSLANTGAGRRARCFDWIWADPSLSIALSPNGHVRSLMLSPVKINWQPFDPLNARDLPDLSRYGIDYSAYEATLAKIDHQPVSSARTK